MAELMQIVAICQEMGWTYDEYLDQPTWFIDLLKAKLEIDSDELRKQIKNR